MSRTLIPSAELQTPAGQGYRAASVVSYLALLTIGVYSALFGPLLPDLARRTGVGLGTAGAIYTALFGAAIPSTMIGGRALDRFGRRWPLVVGLAINGLALLAIPWVGSWPVLLGCMALLGLGDGAVIVGLHVLVAEVSPGREAAALNRLNVFFGVGAVLGPALVAAARTTQIEPRLLPAALGLLQLGYSGAVARHHMPPRDSGMAAATGDGARMRLFSAPLLWLLAVLLLVYVGVEIGLGAWAFTYARQAAGWGGTAAALLSSGFWCALTLGRLVSPLVLRRVTPLVLLIAAPALAAGAALALVLAGGTSSVLLAGVLVAGFGFGPVWPVTFAIAARAFPHAAGSASGVLAMVSAVGGVALPWLQGRVLASGGPAAGIGVTLAGCLAVVALAVAVRERQAIDD